MVCEEEMMDGDFDCVKTDPTTLVKAWFSDPQYWAFSGKSNECIDRQLLKKVDIIGKDVLNLGCFYPEDEIACAAPAKRWVAVDFCQEVIDRCKTLENIPSCVEFLYQDIRCMDFQNEIFDVVIDFSSGDHLNIADFHTMIHEVHRILKSMGTFIITYQNSRFFQGDPDVWNQASGYSRCIDPDDLKYILLSSGFDIKVSENESGDRAGIIAIKVA